MNPPQVQLLMTVNLPGKLPKLTNSYFINPFSTLSLQISSNGSVFVGGVFYFNYFSFVHLIAFNSSKSLSRQPFHLRGF